MYDEKIKAKRFFCYLVRFGYAGAGRARVCLPSLANPDIGLKEENRKNQTGLES
jgi:hypothetical protein